MSAPLLSITGIGSVTPFGPAAGLLSNLTIAPEAIMSWPNAEARRAFQVKPFNPAKLVPGAKTRRLDRLSCWALVAASLAFQDASLDLDAIDRGRVAVVFASGLGCTELTEEFFRSAARNGWNGTDPITFPETLANVPACHIALFHGLRGPNLTVSGENFAAEIALLRAASLLRHGQADRALVVAGDALSPAVFQWYESAGLLAPACFTANPPVPAEGFIPGEGMVALLLERTPAGQGRIYAQLAGGRHARRGDPAQAVREIFSSQPALIYSAGHGSPCMAHSLAGAMLPSAARPFAGEDLPVVAALAVAEGLGASGGLFHLLLALSRHAVSAPTLLLGVAAGGGFAALRLEAS